MKNNTTNSIAIWLAGSPVVFVISGAICVALSIAFSIGSFDQLEPPFLLLQKVLTLGVSFSVFFLTIYLFEIIIRILWLIPIGGIIGAFIKIIVSFCSAGTITLFPIRFLLNRKLVDATFLLSLGAYITVCVLMIILRILLLKKYAK